MTAIKRIKSMVAANRSKSTDRHDVCRKVTVLLKKSYSGTAPKQELPVLETLLYAICLENSPPEQAGIVYARLLNAFHDLNEVRVSSISELQPVFADLSDPEWRAARVKAALQYVFETNYAFDFESLRRKTAELAVKQLAKIPSLSSFVRSYVMQHCLGSHTLPIDGRMHAALVWLGLAEKDQTEEQAGEHLRSFVRKAEAPLFCHLLGCLATDPKRSRAFAGALGKSADAYSDRDAPQRLDVLIKRGDTGGARSKAHKSDTHRTGKNAAHNSRSPRGKVTSKKRH
jgi:endonuclease III